MKLNIEKESKSKMRKLKVSKQDWIEKCDKIYNNYYDYSEVFYNNYMDPVVIICPNHGRFIKKAYYHLKSGCPFCSKNKLMHIDDVKKRLSENKIFDIIDFNEYTHNRQKINVICKKNGHKSIKSINHLYNGVGCSYCSKVKKYTTEERIKIAIEKHGNKYDYSKSTYISSKHSVFIGCRIHGYFKQRPTSHISGSGCPICNKSLGERIISEILETEKIKFESQKSFEGLKHINKLYFDFYLPNYNLCIEFDGMQHHKSYKFFGGDEKLKDTVLKDQIKDRYCLQNEIKLLRISYSINYKTMDGIRCKIYEKIINYLNEL
jgi:very-short-patch-repair endonuclease